METHIILFRYLFYNLHNIHGNISYIDMGIGYYKFIKLIILPKKI